MDSYIQPHRHSLNPKHECLIAVCGLFNLFIFDDNGRVLIATKFDSDLYPTIEGDCGVGVEIPPNVWHTVIALSNSAILFEVKAGPFNHLSAKEFAPWALEEGELNSVDYLKPLKELR